MPVLLNSLPAAEGLAKYPEADGLVHFYISLFGCCQSEVAVKFAAC